MLPARTTIQPVNARTMGPARALLGAAMIFAGIGCASATELTTRPSAPSKSSESAAQAFWGLCIAPASPVRLADGSGGVLITSVEPDSAAAKAGLRKHDILVRCDGQSVDWPEQWIRLVRDNPAGREIVVTFLRAGKVLETKMKAGPAGATPFVRSAGFHPGREPSRWFSLELPRLLRDWLNPPPPTFQSVSIDR
jgi:hypothetical protein